MIFSFKFQKDIILYHLNRSANFFALFLSIVATLIGTYFVLIISDVMKINRDLMNVDNLSKINLKNDAGTDSEKSLLYISIVNLFFYIFIPFVFFYFIEEKNCRQEEDGSNFPIRIVQEYDNENLLSGNCDNSNINPSISQAENNPWNLSLAKNYFYYLIAFSCLNIAYLIGYKINNLDSAKNLIRYSIMPEEMRKASSFNSDFEILAYANIGVLITVGKLLLVIYLPYGLASIIAKTVETLKIKTVGKREYNRLDTNFTKNYETIKNLTTTKIMTGRKLTKKEKQTLKACKDKEAVLQHKQEVLEEKYSNLQKFLSCLMLPLKYMFIFVSIIISLAFIISKGWILYTDLFNSICGSVCGFKAKDYKAKFTIQSIMLYIVELDRSNSGNLIYKALIIVILLMLFAYFTSCVIFSIYKLRIFNLIPLELEKSQEKSQESHLKLILYSIASILSFAILIEIFEVIPDFSYFYDKEKCDLFHITSQSCSISSFGLISIKLYVNFVAFKYLDMLFSILLVLLMTVFMIYLPLKSNFFNQEEKEEEERILRRSTS
jgi:hypothetical protein